MKNSFAKSLLIVPLLLSLCGCVGYRLGSMLPPDVGTVYVPTVVNDTKEPLIETEVSRALIREIQSDGSLRPVRDADAADAHLKVTLVGYKLTPVGYNAARQTTTEEYRLTLTASVVMTRRTTGEVIAENPSVRGEALFQVVGDLTSSKDSALPKAASELAHYIVSAIVETWM